MKRRRLGKTDIIASVLGFGGAEIGYQRVALRTVADLLGHALDAGLNVIDTAECYDESESLIGRAVGHRRRDYYLFTKCGHPAGWGRGEWRRDSILRTLERSLERLRTDHVDVIQLHSCSLAVLRRGEAIEALERARERGLARYIGYSGDGEAAAFAVACGRFDTLQISVNLADQVPLVAIVPAAQERRMGVIAKRPLANVAWRWSRQPSEPYYQPYWSRLRALDYPFLTGDLEAAVATALRFTLTAQGVHTAIVGTTKPERWPHNMASLTAGTLPSDEFQRIRDRWRETASPTWVGQT